MRKTLAISFIIATVLLSSSHAKAWVPIASCGSGYVNWPPGDLPNTWVLRDKLTTTRNFYSQLDDGQIITAVTAGWNVWGGQQAIGCCSAWSSIYQGTTTTSALVNNDAHIIEFIENSWPAGYGSVSSTIAVTIPVWSGCDFVDSDQIYNAVGFTFTTNNNPTRDQTDLQSIAAHENGHWLGLDHSTSSAATMYASYGGGIGPRSLASDDSTGVCALYPGNCGPVESSCIDNADNDADGAIDCDDSDCAGNAACACLATAVLPCNGSVNGNTTGADSTVTDWSCAGWQSTGPERVYTLVSSVSGTVTLNMTNLVNDLDLYLTTGSGASCDPTRCTGVSAQYNQDPEQLTFSAVAGTTYFVVVDGFQGAAGSYTLAATCPGSGPTTEISCTNGLDDDLDGAIDCNDSNCAANAACNQPSSETSCTNGIDDDGDGLLDCGDNDCAANANCNIPANETSCTNGVDDDQDGLADCADNDCAGNPSCATSVCTAQAVLQCGGSANGTTAGGPTQVSTWSCAGWQTTGPEDVYSLTVGQSGTVTINVTNLSTDLDLFVTSGVNGACNPTACIGASGEYDQDPEQVQFAGTAGTTYYIVIDGWQGNNGSYTVSASCPGGATTEIVCGDGLDNDADGTTDCADNDCVADPACAGTCQNVGACCELADSANCDPCELYLYLTGDDFGVCSCSCSNNTDCPNNWSCVDIGGGDSGCWPGSNICEDPEATPTPSPDATPTTTDPVIIGDDDDDDGVIRPPGLYACNCSSNSKGGGLPIAAALLLPIPLLLVRRRENMQ